MKHISVLIKPASSLCNIRCKYCFYANVSSLREVRSFGKMKIDVLEKMIENIYIDLEDGDTLTLAFQGGEPTLAGLAYFKKVVATIQLQDKKVTVHYALQTNGTMINERWCQFLMENDFLVGLSLDGRSDSHNSNRIDAQGKGTFGRVLQTKQLFDRYNIKYNVLCVLTNQLARSPKKVFAFLLENQIRYVQFIPCLDELDAEEKSYYALTPERFASFYQTVFSLWLQEYRRGNYISVKLFDDIYHLFTKGIVGACGMLGNCQVQYVIEADGSVYPCDFYVLDEYRMGYITDSTLKELFEQPVAKEFLCEKSEMKQTCLSCPFRKACNGGCKRMKDTVYVNKKDDFCGYQAVLKQVVKPLLALQLRSN